MFAATVLVCSMSAGVCVAVTDEKGPFKTEKECVERISRDMAPTGAKYLFHQGFVGPYTVAEASCEKQESA